MASANTDSGGIGSLRCPLERDAEETWEAPTERRAGGMSLISEATFIYDQMLANGWYASRDGFGFLIWRRNTEWKPMTEADAAIWWDRNTQGEHLKICVSCQKALKLC